MHHWFIIIYAEKNTYQSVVIRSLSTISRFQINTLPPTPIFPPELPDIYDILKAESLNEQFNSVYTEEGSIPLPNLGESPYGAIEMLPITISGVSDQLNKLNPSKAQGPDGIPPWFLNTYAAQLAPIVHTIFQLSVDSRLEKC